MGCEGILTGGVGGTVGHLGGRITNMLKIKGNLG